ncbi:DUF2809 domain-containing protein [Riemerella columbina]|uniref:ribosomal maturation YjgA family protein n=1 Tax=Riemerella columbina TaxID=103810 RepID=UPI00266E9401|nr:DUF2809 domain-containing protein [Riemerella columbina]WKS95262.1 DUF2809 domain-containing protein [Riemerella columbina]
MKFKFNFKYALIALSVFIAEVLIATVFKHWFILRAYGGDVLVVILLYASVKAFFEVKDNTALVIGILLFSFLIEGLQYFHIAEILGFSPGSLGAIVLGNSFSWADLLCYTLGCGILFLLPYLSRTKENK